MNISLIIPVYNVESYILQCLHSVTCQTFQDGVECILIDDCGTDNSIEIANDFIHKYQGPINFRIIHHEQNRGLSAARNTGIQAAQGDYILFLDSDDELLPGCLAEFTNILHEHLGTDLIQGAYESEMMRQFERVTLPAYSNNPHEIKTLMLDYDRFPIMAQNRLIKRSLICKHNLFFKEGIIHEDCYWTFFLAKHIKSLACLSNKTYFYRTNPHSITGSPNIKKEITSFKTIVEDTSANIDNYTKGAQKKFVLNILHQILSSHYYKTEQDKHRLLNCLYQRCTWYEKAVMSLWVALPTDSSLRTKAFHLLIRLFQFNL